MDITQIEECIKEKMGYVEQESKTCLNCRFYGLVEDDLYIGGSRKCVLNPAIMLNVSPNGSCSFFKEKHVPLAQSEEQQPSKL